MGAESLFVVFKINYMMEAILGTNPFFTCSYFKYRGIGFSLHVLHSSVLVSIDSHNYAFVVVQTILETSVHDQQVPLPWWHLYESACN